MRELGYLYGLRRDEPKKDLAVMRKLLAALGNPERTFRSVLVGGTNGKGSVTAMLAQAMRKSGYRVGRYTSPHLLRFNERIVIDGEEISDADIIRLVPFVRRVAKQQGLQLKFFEFATAMAFVYFRERGVNVAVVEVGLGGRIDPTNVLSPLVSVIVSVALDHMHLLGATLQDIAREKAGIVKEGIPLVTGVRDTSILTAFSELGSRVIVPDRPEAVGEDLAGQDVRYRGQVYRLSLLGAHQRENLAVALEVLKIVDTTMPVKVNQATFTDVAWQGRLQIVACDPLVMVDGAHNEHGALALAEQIPRYDPHTLVLGVGARKDARAMLHILSPLFSRIICTQGEYEPLPADELALIAREFSPDVRVESDAVRAVELARAEGKTVIVAGSLYMIPAVIAHFTQSRTHSA